MNGLRAKISLYCLFLITMFSSCQKDLDIDFDSASIKQVLIANVGANTRLFLNISKSKHPDDYNPVEFLKNCKVDLYENNIFIETLPFVLKDTLSGLGNYVSTNILKENRTYKIVSTHAELGTAIAEEFIQPFPNSAQVTLLQHPDTINTNVRGKYLLTFQDSASANNFYTIAVYYKAQKTIIDSLGVAQTKTDYLYNVPSYNAEVPNTANSGKSFFTDANFDGQYKSLEFDFSSMYSAYYPSLYSYYDEIFFIAEFSNVGPANYKWYIQQLPRSDDNFNDGQNERVNFSSNIQNGFGHFSSHSSVYRSIRLK